MLVEASQGASILKPSGASLLATEAVSSLVSGSRLYLTLLKSVVGSVLDGFVCVIFPSCDFERKVLLLRTFVPA